MSSSYANKNFLVILLSLVIKLTLCNKNILRIPLGLFYSYDNEEDDTSDLIRTIFFNFLCVNLTIGTPPQTVPFRLNINSPTFYVTNKYFNRSASSTYEVINKNESKYLLEDVDTGFDSKDIININGDKRKINFIYATKHKSDYDLGNIGLLIPRKIKNDVWPFLDSLNKAEYINSYIWTLKFDHKLSILDIIFTSDEDKKVIGEFIIGDVPHNYERNKTIYDQQKFIEIDALWSEHDLNWDIEFHKIYLTFKENEIDSKKFNDSKLNIHGDLRAEINPDIGFIVAPIPFFEKISQYFFQKYRNICNQIKISRSLFRYIECQNNEKFNISNFPNISFVYEDDITFNLTYQDLFILDKVKNKFIFLILYEGYTSDWVLGRIFLRKYQFVFNGKTKKIGYYKSMDDTTWETDSDLDKDKIISFIAFILQGIFLLVIVIFIIYLIYKKIKGKNKRQKRINELDEEDNRIDDNKNKELL